MKVLLISLISSIVRRNNERLYSRDMKLDMMLQIDPLLQRYDERGFIRHRDRKALAGELGCYASHILAWQQVIQLDQPVVVLEDDFIL